MRDRLQRARDFWRWFRRSLIWELLARQKKWVRLMLGLALANTAITFATAGTFRSIVDDALEEKTVPLQPLVGRLVVLAIVGAALGFAQRQAGARIAYHLEFELRVLLHRRLLAADPRRLDALATGQMITRAQTDLTLLEAIIIAIPALAAFVPIILGAAVALFVLNPLLAPLALSAIPANLYLLTRLRGRLWGLSWLQLARRAEVTSVVDETVRGTRVVKAFAAEEQERVRIREASERAYTASMARVRLVARFNLLLQPVPIMLSAGLLALGAFFAARDSLSVGSLLIFLMFSLAFVSFARSFDEIASGWQFAKSGAGRIFELMALPEAPNGGDVPLPPPTDGLVFAGVSVGRSLRNIRLHVAAGELGIVTSSPTSESSLIAELASGSLGPAAGHVSIDGLDPRRLDRSALHEAVCVLDEEPFLFGRTVRENIEVGSTGSVTDDALIEALRLAGLSDVIERQDEGLDTVLGDRGYTLSGGQRQRLALARALVSPPRVLIGNDALSMVNPSLEKEIIERLRTQLPATSILWITSRSVLAEIADSAIDLPDWPPAAPSPADTIGRLGDVPYDARLTEIIERLAGNPETPPLAEEDATASDHEPNVRRVLAPVRRLVAYATLALVGLTAVGLVPEGLVKIAIDGIRDGKAGPAYRVALATMLLAGGTAVSTYFFQILAAKVNESILYLLRRRTFQRLTRLGIDFYDRELPGRVAARMVHDLDRISAFADDGVYRVAVSLALLIGAFSIITVWSPPVAVSVAIFVPALAIVSLIQAPMADRAYRWAREEIGNVVARLQEDFAGRRVIHTFVIGERARDGFRDAAWKLRRARKRSATIANSYVEIVAAITGLATAALIRTAGNRALAGQLTIGSAVALLLYLRSALAPIPLLSQVLQSYLAAKASFRTLGEPFRAPINPPESAEAVVCPPLRGDVVLDGVSFAYPGTERPVLRDMSLRVSAGCVLAVVGPTGAGKSTIAKLIARTYDPDAGAVSIDGTDVRALEHASYRHRVGVVPQESYLFRRTVWENIAYGRPGASRQEIELVVNELGAAGLIDAIPGGLDGRVEEEGRNLTPAQRQVVAIARAWLVDPDVLVLDEATSNLDAATERRVLDAIIAKGRTTVMVTHRREVAERADAVVVIEDGRLVESGPPLLIASTGGAYADLWTRSVELESIP